MMEEKHTIIHVFGSLNMGGAESRMMEVYRSIDRTKVNFNFISLNTSKNQYFEKEIKFLGGKIYKVCSPREIGLFRHVKELFKIFKENNKDENLIVHAHTLHHCGVVMFAAKLANVKTRVSQARNTNSKFSDYKSRLFILSGKLLIKLFATERLAITKETANFLYFKRCVKKNKVKIVPNGISLDKFKNVSLKDINHLKSEFKINSNQTIIGHVGRFEKMKNHTFLIKLFFEYRKQNPNSVLVLIGDGSLKNEINGLIKEMKLTKHVQLLGIRKDTHLWMNIFNVVVIPSLFEGLPGVVSEAQAAGTPCVLSDNITKKSDLKLNLLTYVNLNDSLKLWIKAINNSLKIKKPQFKIIEQKFDNENLSLTKTIQTLYRIYKIN